MDVEDDIKNVHYTNVQSLATNNSKFFNKILNMEILVIKIMVDMVVTLMVRVLSVILFIMDTLIIQFIFSISIMVIHQATIPTMMLKMLGEFFTRKH